MAKNPEIIIIVAMTPSGVIGVREKNQLPWQAVGKKLEGDLPRFSDITTGDGNNALIYGRNTLESFRNRALPNRKNFVLSRNDSYTPPENVTRFSNLEDAIAAAQECDQIFIIGGEKVFEEALKKKLVSKMLFTITHDEYEGDVYFPKFDTVRWNEGTKSSFPKKGMQYSLVTLTYRQ